MYKGWQFQRTGRQQYVLSKGFLPKGLPYYMLEAPMSKLSADGVKYDGFEDGAALVATASASAATIQFHTGDGLDSVTPAAPGEVVWHQVAPSALLRQVAGGEPVARLKARLKAASES
jgi:hypothetical protein